MAGIDFGDNIEPLIPKKVITEKVIKEKTINLTYIFKTLFDDRKSFSTISHEIKEKWGFIANRFLSKKFPIFAQTLNVRGGDMGMVLNIWWLYLKDKDKSYYYKWIWICGSVEKSEDEQEIINLLTDKYPDIKTEDIKYLKKYDDFEEEIEYLKKIKQQNG